MDYLDYKFIQVSIHDKNYMDKLKLFCKNNLIEIIEAVKQFVEINAQTHEIMQSSREQLYDFVNYARYDIQYKTKEEKSLAFDKLNEIIGILNCMKISSEESIAKIEAKKRYKETPYGYVNLNIVNEFINDLVIIEDLSKKLDSDYLKKYTLNDDFLSCINAITEENVLVEGILFRNIIYVLKENLIICESYKENNINEIEASYYMKRTTNVLKKLIKLDKKNQKKLTKKAKNCNI